VNASEAPADIAVVDLYGVAPDSRSAAAAVASARKLAASAGIMLTADSTVNEDQRKNFARLGETVFLRNSVEPLIGAIRERLRLASLADEVGDRIRTLVADGRAISFSPTVKAGADRSILIAGRPSPIALAASNAISAHAKHSTCVFSAGQAMRALEYGAFLGAVFIPRDENDLLIPLARALRRHREHRRLPVIIVSDDEDLLDSRAAKDGLDIMAASQISDDLYRRLETTTRRATMAAAMRAFLRSPEGNGADSGAASPRLFAQHAYRSLARADETGRPVSFVMLSVAARADERSNIIARAALDDAIRTAARLIRAEDMIARLTATTLVFMFRGTCGEDADRAARRLEGVIVGTQPRSAVDHLDVRAAAIERANGVEIERVIAALVAELRHKRNQAVCTSA